MPDFVYLTCPSCSEKLQINQDIERFACGQCGNEYLVNRSGGIITLEPVLNQPILKNLESDNSNKDRTHTEFDCKKLIKEIKILKHDKTNVKGGYLRVPFWLGVWTICAIFVIFSDYPIVGIILTILLGTPFFFTLRKYLRVEKDKKNYLNQINQLISEKEEKLTRLQKNLD